MSTTKAKYIDYSTAVQEAVWLRNFLCGIHLINEDQPILMNVDSTPAISIVTEPKFNNRSKHVEKKYHFVQEKAENGEIYFIFICLLKN